MARRSNDKPPRLSPETQVIVSWFTADLPDQVGGSMKRVIELAQEGRALALRGIAQSAGIAKGQIIPPTDEGLSDRLAYAALDRVDWNAVCELVAKHFTPGEAEGDAASS